MNRKQANEILPKERTKSEVNPASLVVLLIAEAKWGKTSFFMSNPNSVLLAFEEGHKFQRGFKIIVDKWDVKRGSYDIEKDKEGCPHMTAMQAIEVLEASDLYDFVTFDTVDMAVKMCVDYHCSSLGVEHPTDAGDYGKGWDITQNTPMRRAILRILKTGRGVGLITHSKTEVQRFTSGERARKEATMPNGVMRLCVTQADVMLHGEYGKLRAGNRLRDRILVCEGDMDTLAGNRSGTMLPQRYIVDPRNQWKQFKCFFTDPRAADRAESDYRRLTKKGKD